MDFQAVSRYVCQLCLSVQIVWSLDQVTLLNPPAVPLPDHRLKILYYCDEPATVRLDCIISFDTGVTHSLLLKQWACVPGSPKVNSLALNLPDWLLYQTDEIPDSQWVLSCILRASVTYGGFDDTELYVAAQDVAVLHPKPFYSRPIKPQKLCMSWSSQMLQFTQRISAKRCPLEQETMHLLTAIYASTGEHFGITKSAEPFTSGALEHMRVRAISFPWCAFSIWIFVTRHCQERLCGVFYHINSHNDYATPTVLLKRSGQLHVQMSGEHEESSAFLSPFKMSTQQPHALNKEFTVRVHQATLSMVCMGKKQRMVHSMEQTLTHPVMLDDTEGYFVIGGGKYISGAEGFFGPAVYHRNRIPPHAGAEVVIPDVIRSVNLTGWRQACQGFRLEMISSASAAAESDSCLDIFHEWMTKARPQAAAPHRRRAAELAESLSSKHGRGAASLPAVGRALYSLSLQELSRGRSSAAVSTVMPLLLQAGCLADNRALLLASVLYRAGLGVHRRPGKAALLALLAAQSDDRLALLHLGNLHHLGLHGAAKDPDLAYGYYANIAQQTTVDRNNPTPEQTFVEAVYLNNDEVLNLQTNEDHHIFQWLKLQARRGAADAEQALARMLFWGQQGVSPNIQKAVRHYERGAVQLQDPVSMYDYAIVLMQGHGVEKDVPKAVTFLKKAMDKGFVPAINALAWYHEHFERDYARAVRLWERADLLQSPDAALNLAVMHSQGLYPGKAADQYKAYEYYRKSAERGHIRGAVQLADIWTTGIPGLVARRPSDAVLWAKWAAEHNGHLGTVLRRALDSHMKSDAFSSLLYYMIAAESGFAAAQFNVAYLCEQHAGQFLDPAFVSDCMWTYYNLTLQSQDPEPYAMIRMGDLFYERQRDSSSAAEMYKQAALKDEPQGWYNLGLLAEEGYRLPLSVLSELGLSQLHAADRRSLLSALYRRCRDSEDTHSYLPCSLALFNVYLRSLQKDYSSAIKFSSIVAVVAAPTILIILGVVRRRGQSLN
ncbi:protein sel-1 homolog 3 isoform X2 [Betta splendens]|uniref:Protein sel-1 homolog 3 isoform X2 n=1 Tax=Betta splendens TaxID=158456 RepID=A0A8M1HLD5_BETSP|nr:protein sel-1 homolog 3 isoform X2 [Betta splendens]